MKANTKPVTILLVEDDDVDAMTVTRSFNKQKIGNEIIRACDGIEALEKMRGADIEKPYVILLDLQMPRMGGLEFLEAIRSDPELANSIVFVLTTSKAEKDITASYEMNIAGYFVKGDAAEEFLKIVTVLDDYWNIVHVPNESV